jgi:hypothetical protein
MAAACALSSVDAARAAREGAALAQTRTPYVVQPWVLWDRRAPTTAVRDRADLDAVVIETPYERVRSEGYLQRLQSYPVGSGQIEHWRREASDHLGFVVFAHSRTSEEREAKFLTRFSRATVTLRGGPTLRAVTATVFGVNDDFYDVRGAREVRYTGALTYRFDNASPCRASVGTLRFTDAQHRPYAITFDMTKYR